MNNERFDLASIAGFLEGLEDSIIFKMLDRAQVARNLPAYKPGGGGFSAWPAASILETRLRFQEDMDARFDRFSVPEERPYTDQLPAPERSIRGLPSFPVPHLDVVRQSDRILDAYLKLLDLLCAPGDDGQYGSAVEHDVFALQSIGRRIHFGSFYVAESKFRGDVDRYRALAAARDEAGLMALLTRKEVEDRILVRVREKVLAFQNLVNPAVRRPIDPGVVVAFYQDTVIPLTKAGELAYLLNRNPEGIAL